MPNRSVHVKEMLSCFSCVVASKPGSCVTLAETHREVPEAAGKLFVWTAVIDLTQKGPSAAQLSAPYSAC